MSEEELGEYLVDDNASSMIINKIANPSMAWNIPIVTGHKYYIKYSNDYYFGSLKVLIA